MYLGEIVEIGPAERILENPEHPYVKILLWSGLPGNPHRAREKLDTEAPMRNTVVPDIQAPPSCCRFHTRCPKAREACARESPTLGGPEGGTHRVSCFRPDATHKYWDDGFLDADGEIEIPGHESD